MTLTRTEEWVEMHDVHHTGQIVCPRVQFRLDAFASALVEACQPWLAFRRHVLDGLQGHRHADTIRQNLGDDWDGAVQTIADRLRAPSIETAPGSRLPDPDAQG